MEQYAQDLQGDDAPDMGVAYEFTVRARRYYKKGVRENELKQLLELVVINEDNKIVGRIASDMVGGFVISDDKNEEQWHVSANEIWDAYMAMRKNLVEEDR